MTLDAFTRTQRDAAADASQNIAPDLPATFGESYDVAVRAGLDWHSSAAYQLAKEGALDDHVRGIRDLTGATLPNPGYLIGGASLDDFNKQLAGVAERFPDFDLKPLTPDDVDRMTLKRMGQAHASETAMAGREKTWAGTAGGFLGGAAAAIVDPVNVALLPFTLSGTGIALRAAEFAGLGFASQVGNEIIAGPERERAVPGAESPTTNVAVATLGGAAMGVGFGALGRLLEFWRGKKLPTSLQDEIQVGTSEAQIQATNIWPGAEGEMAHRDTLAAAVGQVARGERVSVDLPPEVLSRLQESVTPVLEAHAAAGQAEGGLATLAGKLEDLTRAVGHELAPEDTRALAERLAAMPPEAVPGALGEAALRPLTIMERVEHGPARREVPVAPIGETPLGDAALQGAALRNERTAADPAVDEGVLREMDRVRVERPDAEFAEMVRNPDGTTTITRRPLESVLAELDDMERASKELAACVTGMAA